MSATKEESAVPTMTTVLLRSFRRSATGILGVMLVLVLATWPTSPAAAGDQTSCVISGVGAFTTTAGWYLQCDGGTRTGVPACSTIANQWAKSWTDAGSREIYALAISLWLSGIPVRVNGTGSCDNLFGSRETLNGLERQGM
jgi:hypothetical protein